MEMKVVEIEGVLEKIWELHDKLSDAIHSINSSSLRTNYKTRFDGDNRTGFVFVKGLTVSEEARSLNSIRTALENLQDQFEFVHVCLLSFDFIWGLVLWILLLFYMFILLLIYIFTIYRNVLGPLLLTRCIYVTFG